jgi:hypothetical protein
LSTLPSLTLARSKGRSTIAYAGALAFAAFACAAGCRAVLGIEERPLLEADGGESDADEPLDPELDAGADVRPETSCDSVTPAPAFCADFDWGDVLGGWSNENRKPDLGQAGGGTITADDTTSKSEPRSANLRIPAVVASTQTASAILVKTVRDLPAEGAQVDFDVKIDTELFPDGKGLVPLLTAYLGVYDKRTDETIILARGPAGMYLASADELVKVTSAFPLGVWISVSITFDRRSPVAGSGGVAKLRFDVRDAASVTLATKALSSPELTISLGPITSGPIGAFGMHVDNVRVYRRADL